MTEIKKPWIKRDNNFRDLLFVITLVFLVVYAVVLGDVWGDRNYTNNFWGYFFEYSAYVVLGLLLIFWAIWWSGQGKK